MSQEPAIDQSELEKAIVGRARALFPEEARLIENEAGRLAQFLRCLLEANEAFNLISSGSAAIPMLVGTHLADALAGLRHLPAPEGARRYRLLDIGSGGGFPAVPLLIVRRDLEGWLFESTTKKARFLEDVGRRLALTSTVVNARFPTTNPMREIPAIDIFTTRAVAGAGGLLRAARPYLAHEAQAMLWTTRRLFDVAVRESGFHRATFHGTPGRTLAGIAVLECST